jgi:uncharacterized membrane protein YkoI
MEALANAPVASIGRSFGPMFIPRSSPGREARLMRYAGLVFALNLLAALPAAAAEPAPERECYSAAQTRERIAVRKLAEPFRLMTNAATRFQAEAIGAKLCRWKEQLVYEITLLRRDGRVIHVFTNAATGQMIGAKNAK